MFLVCKILYITRFYQVKKGVKLTNHLVNEGMQIIYNSERIYDV